MPEPIEIAKGENPYSFERENGALVTLTWDMLLSSMENNIIQVRVLNQDESLWHRNISFAQLEMGESLSFGWTNAYPAYFDDSFTEFVPTEIVLPTKEELFFLAKVWLRSNTDLCNVCELSKAFCKDAHLTCDRCQEPRAQSTTTEYSLMDGWSSSTEYYLCSICENAGYDLNDVVDAIECDGCNELASENSGIVNTYNIIGYLRPRHLCDSCRDDYYWCDGCERLGLSGDFEDGDEDHCNDCCGDNDSALGIREWNYEPEFTFHPAIPVDPLKPLYIGIEWELNWYDYRSNAAQWIDDINNDYEGLLYVKSDSSIDEGFEVVTHPMSPEWALENLPLEIFEKAIDEGAEVNNNSCGTHIHIDKASLTTAQMWKMLQLHFKLKDFCGMVGGRGTTAAYASWDEKKNMPIQANMLKIARDKGEAFGEAARYVPVNLMNANTIELRYMDGSIAAKDIKKNIEWVQALYDFTDTISVHDIKQGVLNKPNYLAGWILRGNYPNLAEHISREMFIPVAMPERSV